MKKGLRSFTSNFLQCSYACCVSEHCQGQLCVTKLRVFRQTSNLSWMMSSTKEFTMYFHVCFHQLTHWLRCNATYLFCYSTCPASHSSVSIWHYNSSMAWLQVEKEWSPKGDGGTFFLFTWQNRTGHNAGIFYVSWGGCHPGPTELGNKRGKRKVLIISHSAAHWERNLKLLYIKFFPLSGNWNADGEETATTVLKWDVQAPRQKTWRDAPSWTGKYDK